MKTGEHAVRPARGTLLPLVVLLGFAANASPSAGQVGIPPASAAVVVPDTSATQQVPVSRSPGSTARPRESESVLSADLRFGAGLVLHGLSAPARWTTTQWLLVPGSGLAAVLLVHAADGPVEHFEDGRRNRGISVYFAAVEPLGQLASFGVVAGLYGGGMVWHRPTLRRTAVEALAASVVAGGVVTPLIKLAAGRARPRQKLGTEAFVPFSGDESFPSGHTTQAFAVASVIAAESPSLWVDLLAYGLAGSVGAARVYHDAHFLSDVAAGAAIGTLVGRSMAVSGRSRWTTEVRPYVGASDSGGVSLGLSVPLGAAAPK